MAIKTVKWLIKDTYRKLRVKWWQPVENHIIGRYLLFIGIRWKQDILQHMVDDEDNTYDPLDTAEFTKFFIDITKTIPWYKYKTDKETKEKVKVLLDNKYDENWKKKLIEKESLANT